MDNEEFRCIIAGGGTGGHLFPGIAVARELERRMGRTQILFVVGHRKMETEILRHSGYAVRSIDVEGLKGRSLRKALPILVRLPKSLLQSIRLLKEFSPRLIFGVGGYSAGPLCLAAKFMGLPTAIHEQNSYPGMTNRFLSRFVDLVFISFEESRAHFPVERLILTGNPIREDLLLDEGEGGPQDKPFTLLVVGGSQGAQAINSVFVEALEVLRNMEKYPEVIHQTGEGDHSRVREEYQKRGLKGEVIPFIQNMAEAYARADLVVSRAGATTIFELAALGKPAILIPYPFAANRHQETNARALVRSGGAEMIHQGELTGRVLAEVLNRLMGDRLRLKEMGQRARSIARMDASKIIVEHLLEITKFGMNG